MRRLTKRGNLMATVKGLKTLARKELCRITKIEDERSLTEEEEVTKFYAGESLKLDEDAELRYCSQCGTPLQKPPEMISDTLLFCPNCFQIE